MSPKTRRSSANDKQATASSPSLRPTTTRRTRGNPSARSSARLNRNSRQNASSTNPSTSTTSSAVEEDNRLGGSIPPFSDENETGDISVIDLVSPHASRLMRRTRTQPLEVDLTCDVDEEVRDRNLPVTLGASPPSVRPATGRTRRLASQISAGPTPSIVQLTSDVCTPSSETQGQDNPRGIYCPICLDSLTQVKTSNRQMYSTTCGHLFCGPCITRVLASTNQCPTCRQSQNLRKIHPIFI